MLAVLIAATLARLAPGSEMNTSPRLSEDSVDEEKEAAALLTFAALRFHFQETGKRLLTLAAPRLTFVHASKCTFIVNKWGLKWWQMLKYGDVMRVVTVSMVTGRGSGVRWCVGSHHSFLSCF